MLYGLFILLACQLTGEAAMRLLGAPVPGPVAGILLLIAYLALADRFGAGGAADAAAPVGSAADGLLRYLGLLFVPAGVGVAQSYGLILANGPAILATLVVSTVLTLLATVGAFRWIRRGLGEDAR